jgi:DNA-binding CsgD family transcriptional regulator
MHACADELTDRIYEAALDPREWQAVAEGIARIFGGSPVNLGLLISGVPGLAPRYLVGMRPEGAVEFLEYLVAQPQWSTRILFRCADRFGDLSEDFPEVDLSSTAIYTEWMKPRGLAPIWPAAHTLLGQPKQSLGGFLVFRREGEGPFTEAELAEATRCVPHLRRAARIVARLGAARREGLALVDVVDRLPTGVLILDSRRRVVFCNRAAQRIIDLDDGFGVDGNGPNATDARDNSTLQTLIADALEQTPQRPVASRGFATISRPSGRRDFTLMVSPLLAPARGLASDGAVAILIVDPEWSAPPMADVLEEIYSLTPSEAEIVRLLSTGLSLEEVARARAVSMHTARSHLKRAFAKTGTSRQGELVRLIVAGIGAVRFG